jgi:hypothetical protein
LGARGLGKVWGIHMAARIDSFRISREKRINFASSQQYKMKVIPEEFPTWHPAG